MKKVIKIADIRRKHKIPMQKIFQEVILFFSPILLLCEESKLILKSLMGIVFNTTGIYRNVLKCL